MLNRRQFSAASGLLLSVTAWAQFRVEISGVGATQVPIAVARVALTESTRRMFASSSHFNDI